MAASFPSATVVRYGCALGYKSVKYMTRTAPGL
jgi:hypothetical protein